MDAQLETKRLFIAGLFDGIKKEDLVEKFSKFGQVDNVDIKVKESNGCTNTIAFVEMLISPQNLAKCFRVYSNTRWKGCDLKLEVAKESFLSRLQKERELASGKSKVPSQAGKSETDFSPESIGAKDKFGKKVDQESVGDNFSVEFRNKDTISRKNNGEVLCRTHEPSNHVNSGRNGFEAERHTSEERPCGDNLLSRLEKFSGTWNDFEVVGSESRKPAIFPRMPSIDKKLLSEKKRLESIQSKISESNTKQKLIKEALKNQNINSRANNKIIFDEEYEQNCAVDDLAVDFQSHIKSPAISDKQNMALFDSDSDEESGEDTQHMFNVKPQYEGEAGQQLIALQSRFGNDERFKIDERFAEKDPETKSSEEDETQRQLGVLESVLGYELTRRPKDQDANAWSKIKQMRYDPTQENAAELEIQAKDIVQKSSKKESKQATANENLPEVSKERYYKVSGSLKEVFNKNVKSGNEHFNLFQALGIDEPAKTDVRGNFSEPARDKPFQLPRASWDINPFKYDSSSDEEEEATPAPRKKELHDTQEERKEPVRLAGKRQTFFVFEGDSRLKDGVEFFTKPENMDEVYENWKKTKFQVIQEFRSNQKNVLRKKATSGKVAAAGRKRAGKPKPRPKQRHGKKRRQ